MSSSVTPAQVLPSSRLGGVSTSQGWRYSLLGCLVTPTPSVRERRGRRPGALLGEMTWAPLMARLPGAGIGISRLKCTASRVACCAALSRLRGAFLSCVRNKGCLLAVLTRGKHEVRHAAEVDRRSSVCRRTSIIVDRRWSSLSQAHRDWPDIYTNMRALQ